MRSNKANAAALGPAEKKRRNRRWRTLVDVGCPHLERRGCHLEAQPDQDHGQPKLEKRAMKKLLGAHFGQHRRTARAIHQRNPVEKKRRRERAQQEILHRRFGRLQRIAAVSRQDVAGDRTHFQADERGEQLLRRSKHAHAGRGKQQQRVKFREGKPFALQVRPGRQHDEKRHRAHEQPEEKTKGIGLHQPAEARPCMHCCGHGCSRSCQRPDHCKKRKKVAAAHERLHQHHQHAEAAPHQFRKHAIHVDGAGKHLADFQPFT